MRGAMVLLLAADRSPQRYPTRNPTIVSTLLKLANSLMEVSPRLWAVCTAGRICSCC